MKKSYTVTITSSGQITLPAEIRRKLGVKPGERVRIEVEDETIKIEAPAYTWESAIGSVKPINRPEDFEAIIQEAKEEHAERLMRQMRE